ncbi:hypothetical protein NECID01_1561 [Nematocida sp. AWRm77]|nr:hypothetical protein NECID01_1561 [Nematocida sp. AWRm77]
MEHTYTCLVVTKDGKVPPSEESMVHELGKLIEVEVASTSQMIAAQEKYARPSRYAAIVVLGGDGSILKGASICSPKKILGAHAEYIDKLGDEHVPVHASVRPEESVFCTHEVYTHWAGAKEKSVLPVIFAFDHSTRGRLCNIKNTMFEEGSSALFAYVQNLGNPAYLQSFYAQTLCRSRFLVNRSVHVMNEIYIFCNEKGFIDTFEVCVNDKCLFNGIRCDGIIVCTSLGASGYNASANGPLLYAGVDCLVVTTVCSPDRKVPSIVVSASDKITIRSKTRTQKLAAVLDGCLRTEDTVFEIERSPCGEVYFASFAEHRYHDDFIRAV